MVVLTHDRGCAQRALEHGVPHVRFRTFEVEDRDRLEESLLEIVDLLTKGATRIMLFKGSVRVDV
jgi:hypothetical protein